MKSLSSPLYCMFRKLNVCFTCCTLHWLFHILQDTSLFVSHFAGHFTLRFTSYRTLHSSFHILQDTSLFVSHFAGHFTLRFTFCRTLHSSFHMLQDTSLPVPYVQDTSLYHKLPDILLCRFTKQVALDFAGGLDISLETIKFRILHY